MPRFALYFATTLSMHTQATWQVRAHCFCSSCKNSNVIVVVVVVVIQVIVTVIVAAPVVVVVVVVVVVTCHC